MRTTRHVVLPLAIALTLGAWGCAQKSPDPQTVRETGYLGCVAAAGCTGALCTAAAGGDTCEPLPAACADTATCACAAETLCGTAACHDVAGGVRCVADAGDAGTTDAGISAIGGFAKRICSEEGHYAVRLHVSNVDVACDDDADAGPTVVLDLYHTGASVLPVAPGTTWVLGTDVEFTGARCPGGGPCVPIVGGTVTFDTFDLTLPAQMAAGIPASAGSYTLHLQDGTELQQRFDVDLCRPEPADCPLETGSLCIDCGDCDCPDGRHIAGPGTCDSPIPADFCDCARICAIVHCGGDGIAVSDGGEDFCVHADVPTWSCPPDLPVRNVFQGAVVCGHEALGELRTVTVGRIAMRTGEVPMGVDILSVVRADGDPQLVFQAGGEARVRAHYFHCGNWANLGETPPLCDGNFDHLASFAEGNALQLSAWSNVVCGPDEVIQYTCDEGDAAYDLGPLAAGDYDLLFREVSTGVDHHAPVHVEPALACPATSAFLDVSARPYNTADDSYHMLAEGTTHFTGTVFASAAGTLTLQPDAADWRVELTLPAEVAPGLAEGDAVTVDLGLNMPFWEEYAFVVRGPAGMAVAAINGSLGWLQDPMFQAPDLTLALGADCPVRAADCQSQIDHEVLLSGGGEALHLLAGQSGAVTLGGAQYQATLGDASTGIGEPMCTDLPNSWISLAIGRGNPTPGNDGGVGTDGGGLPDGGARPDAGTPINCDGLLGQPCANQDDACCPADEAHAVCLPDGQGTLVWQRTPAPLICTCDVPASALTHATCEAI